MGKGPGPKRIQKVYRQRFRAEWKVHPELKSWILEDPNNEHHATCKYCKCKIQAKFCHLLAHVDTRKHQVATDGVKIESDNDFEISSFSSDNGSNGNEFDIKDDITDDATDDVKSTIEIVRTSKQPVEENKKEDFKRTLKDRSDNTDQDKKTVIRQTTPPSSPGVYTSVSKSGQVLYPQRFRPKWLTNPQLKDWLCEDPEDEHRAVCKYCKCGIQTKLSQLLAHVGTRKHQKSIEKFDETFADDDDPPTTTSVKQQRVKNNLIKKYEVKRIQAKKAKTITNNNKKTNNVNKKNTVQLKIEHKIILKCRVCLDEYDEDKMYDLFKEGAPPMLSSENNRDDEEDKLKLSEKLEYCCGVRIRESPEMPTKICTKCFDMARIWFNFRKVCVTSQVYLESMCKDREKPDELTEDGEYLEYLMEDLQTFRAKARQSHSILAVKVDAVTPIDSDDDYDNEANDNDHSESFGEISIKAVPFEDVNLDAELETIMQNIKREDDENTDMLSNNDTKDEITEEMVPELEEEVVDQYYRPKHRKFQNKSVRPKIKRSYRPPSPSSYMCNICGNVYNKKASFTYHMNVHSDVKTHACELCGKAFRQVSELKNHMRRHTGEKPYKCNYCDRRFIDRSEKHRHERVHTNTRPYVCKVCGKSFIYSATLKNHFKLHSGEKNFNCLVCQKAFTLQHQLKSHLLTATHKQKEAQLISAGYEVVYE